MTAVDVLERFLWLVEQVLLLALVPLPMFAFGWAIAKEEVGKEIREWFGKKHKDGRLSWIVRKFCYMPTCEFCSSAWVGLFFMTCVRLRVFLDPPDTKLYGWSMPTGTIVGFLFAWGCFVAVAWFYIGRFSRLRTDSNRDKAETKAIERGVISCDTSSARQSGYGV